MKITALLVPILSLAVFLGTAAGQQLARSSKPANPVEGTYGDTHRFVFFAVLEGLYNEGLSDHQIDIIIPPGENGDRQLSVNFVYTCPLCHPAFEAFRLYAARKPFIGQKVTAHDTFGPGPAAAIRLKLHAEEAQDRRDAIQELISKWIDARIALLGLTDEKTRTLREEFAKLRKEGEKALTRFQEGAHGEYYTKIYGDWKTCAICSGASPMGGSATSAPGVRE